MKNIFVYLFFVSILLYSCGGKKTIENNGGVKLSFSGVGESSLGLHNNRLASIFPNALAQLNNGNLQIEIPSLVSYKAIEKLIEGKGLLRFSPAVGGEMDIRQNQIKDIELVLGQMRKYEVVISMEEETANQWSEMTKQNINQAIQIYVDEHLISAPIVRSQISGGRVSLIGKNDLESKVFYAMIKYPSESKENVSIVERNIFIKNEKNTIVALPQSLILRYDNLSKSIAEQKSKVISFVNSIEMLQPNVRSLLGNDLKRMAENEIERYLSVTQFNTKQFENVLTNAERLIDSYNNGYNKIKMIDEAGQRIEELLKTISGQK